MKRWNQMALTLCLAAATTACAGDQAPESTTADEPAAVGTAGRVNPDADREFIEDMMADGTAEVELGRLVQEKSKNREVRQFAAMMIEDHTQAGLELRQIATDADIEARANAEGLEAHTELKEQLSELSGPEFDRAYMKAMVDDHQKAVDAAEEKADDARSDHVKQWAAKALPTLKKHLEQARQIQENFGQSGI